MKSNYPYVQAHRMFAYDALANHLEVSAPQVLSEWLASVRQHPEQKAFEPNKWVLDLLDLMPRLIRKIDAETLWPHISHRINFPNDVAQLCEVYESLPDTAKISPEAKNDIATLSKSMLAMRVMYQLHALGEEVPSTNITVPGTALLYPFYRSFLEAIKREINSFMLASDGLFLEKLRKGIIKAKGLDQANTSAGRCDISLELWEVLLPENDDTASAGNLQYTHIVYFYSKPEYRRPTASAVVRTRVLHDLKSSRISVSSPLKQYVKDVEQYLAKRHYKPFAKNKLRPVIYGVFEKYDQTFKRPGRGAPPKE